MYAGPQAAAATSAGLSIALNGGSQSDVGKAGAIAYAASWATTGVGRYASDTANAYGGATGAAAGGAIQVVGTAVINGAANAAMGGKFEDGFISGAVSSAMFVGAGYVGAGRVVGEIGVHAVVGGTMAEIGSGKFANGAAWAVFEYLAFGAITSGLASQTTGENLEVQRQEVSGWTEETAETLRALGNREALKSWIADEFWGSLKLGGMATVDGAVPFADPFQSAEGYQSNEGGVEFSKQAGGVARDAALMATGAGMGGGSRDKRGW